MPTAKAPTPPAGTQSVCRALDLLITLGSSKPGVSISELSALLKLNISTTSRLIGALQAYDFVTQSRDTQRIQLGPRCHQLGQVFVSQVEVATVAEPFMYRLTTKLNRPTHLGVLSENRLVHVKHVEPEGYVFRISPSDRFALGDLYCEAIGKVVLAYQPDETVERIVKSITLKRYTPTTITSPKKLLEEVDQIRARGYAIDEAERTEGVRCVAVPIWNHDDKIAAGLSASGTHDDLPADKVQDLAKVMQETSEAISHRMGASASVMRPHRPNA
jgi:IclR family transcriptional regulator, KDG regulon repressor